jgi:anti-sigma B factor antagonist
VPVSTRKLEDNNAVAVDLTGELDMSSSPEVRQVLVGLVDQRTPRILLNLAGTEYIDSSGLATFVECLQGVKRYGGTLRLYGVGEQIIDVFKLARLDTVFEITDDEASAIAD